MAMDLAVKRLAVYNKMPMIIASITLHFVMERNALSIKHINNCG